MDGAGVEAGPLNSLGLAMLLGHPVEATAPTGASRALTTAGPDWSRCGSGPGTDAGTSGVEQVHPTKGDTMFQRTKNTIPAADEALAGRPERPFQLSERHKALDAPLVTDEVPEGYEVALFGLGCFWGAEEIFWQVPGRLVDVGRVRRRRHAQPVVRRGLQRPHRPHRGRPRRLRPGEGLLRRPGRRPSTRSTTRPRACARATTSARSTARRSTSPPPSRSRSPGFVTERYQGELTKRGLRPDHHRDQARAALLLRRGPAPAVPAEEPLRLPVPLRHRREGPPGLTLGTSYELVPTGARFV